MFDSLLRIQNSLIEFGGFEPEWCFLSVSQFDLDDTDL